MREEAGASHQRPPLPPRGRATADFGSAGELRSRPPASATRTARRASGRPASP
ncbi:MAG: hypothetical protein M0C28_14985 [Candidatus Moduliflexus flocculans]|nr:hypothetical protein [Candidatus Moduliflexus flocculans]